MLLLIWIKILIKKILILNLIDELKNLIIMYL